MVWLVRHLEKLRLTALVMERVKVTPWWHHISVMAAYAAMDRVLYEMSSNNWVLTAGLRLSCLLLVSRRFWPAIIGAEWLAIAGITLPVAAARYGLAWEMATLIPPSILCAPLVYMMQNHAPIFDRHGRINPTRLLVVALLCTVAGTLRSTITLLALDMQDGSPNMDVTWDGTLEWILGGYLGTLTITPSVLAIRERLLDKAQPLTWSGLLRRSLLRDVLLFELPIVLAMLLATRFLIGGHNLTYFRVAMIAPVIVLGIRHGWHGTAIGGTVASFFLFATTLDHRDPSLISSQTALALAISTWFIWTQKRPSKPWPPQAAYASAWIGILSLIPVLSIRRAFGPRYRAPDGILYRYDGSMVGRSAT